MTTPPRPPGPRDGLFGIRLVGQIKRDILGFYGDLHREYGDVVYMRLGPYHDFTVFHPEQIREVLVEKAKDFIRMARPLRVLSQWNGQGILIVEGETWIRHRRILQPAFNRSRFARYAEEAASAAAATLDRLAKMSGPVDFEQTMTDLTTAVICRTMFGTDLGDDRAEVRRAVQILSDVALREMMAPFTLPDWLPLPGKSAKRWAIRDVEIGGWVVPKGGIVRIMTHVTQHDPRWYPEPGRFDPDRFSPGRIEGIPPGGYLPFGLGPRACIGNQFSMMEMSLVTAMLLQRFTLSPADGQKEPALHAGLSLRPIGGMRLLVEPRHPRGAA